MNKNEILKLRIDATLKEAFKNKCKKEGFNMTQVLEHMIRKSLLENTNTK